MVPKIKRTFALVVCLASSLAGGTAAKPRASWRELPDPFATCSRPRPKASEEKRFQDVRVVWTPRDRAESFSLLFAACLCLIALEMRVMRRSTGRHQRLASLLSGALRGGALEFTEPKHSDEPIWGYATDEDESQEPERPPQPEVNRSRYELLAYDITDEYAPEDLKVTISYLGGGPDPDAPIRDEDLLLGVPREFINPERMEPHEESEDEDQLALTAGSTDGDDPGESVDEPDLT